MSGNFQTGIHPDADQLSVFVEGAATAWEQKRMLAHLAECADCRKAVFLMQPHEETQAATATVAKGWMWRRLLLPVGLPAAALACGLIAVLIYIRPHGGAAGTPMQSARERQPKIERPGTTVVPTTKSDRAPGTNSEQLARSRRRQSRFAPSAKAAELSRKENRISSGLNLPAFKNQQATANVAPQKTGAPSASAPSSDAARAQSAISSTTTSNLLLDGQDAANMKAPQAPDTKGAASQSSLARKKELPGLEIESLNGQAYTLAGVSGRVTDRTGAVIVGAMLTLRDAAGKTRQTTTGRDGSFRLTDLPAGQYELMATANGFATKTQPIELKPRELAMLQPILDVGATSETVEVNAAAAAVQTESANVSGQVIEGMPSAGQVIAGLSILPLAATISHGSRFLSLDSAGNLFLSRNGGKKWKKINPQWAGKAVRIELTPASKSEATPKLKNESSASAVPIFQLTTDAHAVWTSKDGKHWHQQ